MSTRDVFDACLPTPITVLGIRVAAGHLTEVRFLPPEFPAQVPSDRFAAEVCRQLTRYLADPTQAFELPLAPAGTPYQQRVWTELARIPVGTTCTYGELAVRLRSGARAVGQACGANPIPVIIPCHRVLARGGGGGFMHQSGGQALGIKHWLLQHESR